MRDAVMKWLFRASSALTFRCTILNAIWSWNRQNGRLNVVSQSTTLNDRIRKWKKKIHNSVYKKYEVFFKVIGRRPISKDSAVPYRQGTENSVSKQERKLRNWGFERLFIVRAIVIILHKKPSFDHKLTGRVWTIGGAFKGQNSWTLFRQGKLVSQKVYVNFNQSWTNFQGTVTGFLLVDWKIFRQIKVNTSKVPSSLYEMDEKIVLAATKLGGSGKPIVCAHVC